MNSEQAIVLIQGKEYFLSEELFNSMDFFVKNNAISGGVIKVFNIQNPQIVSTDYFQIILSILKAQNYNIMVPPKVKSNNPQDIFSQQPILTIFKKLSIEQLKRLYTAAHYLEVKNLRQCIAAYLATFVYVSQLPLSFDERRKELNISTNITNEDIKEYSERYFFLN